MFGKFSAIRFSPSITFLLMVVLSASSGCRWLSSKFSSPTPPVSQAVNVPTPLPQTEESGRYSAFRPVMTEPFTPPVSVPEQVVPAQPLIEQEKKSEPSKIEWKPDAAQSKIDELNKKVTELESQLEEAKKHPPAPAVLPSPDVLLPEKETKVDEVKKLPVINKQGVMVSSDELQRIRIEVRDKVLFMPNAWQLTPEGEETLRTIAAEIRAFDPEADLDIEGHTDSLISDPRNLLQKHDVSSGKAMTIMDFFVNTLRWDAARIGISSFGRRRPVADNGTPEGRDRNNRIEIVLRNRGK